MLNCQYGNINIFLPETNTRFTGPTHKYTSFFHPSAKQMHLVPRSSMNGTQQACCHIKLQVSSVTFSETNIRFKNTAFLAHLCADMQAMNECREGPNVDESLWPKVCGQKCRCAHHPSSLRLNKSPNKPQFCCKKQVQRMFVWCDK